MSVRDTLNIPIQNPGFENPAIPDGSFTLEPPTGWRAYNPDGLFPGRATINATTITSNIDAFNPSSYFYPNEAPEGENVGNVSLVQAPGSGIAGLFQTLDTSVVANTKYTLTVSVGSAIGNFLNFDLTGSPGYRVELLAGDEAVAVDNNSLTIEDGTFSTSTVTYTSSAGESILGKNLGIRLVNLLNGGGVEVDFDNVQLKAEAVAPTNVTARTLYGTGAAETLNGSLGNDTIFGNGGADTIFGGDGNDSVYGSSSNEYIQGGAGNDTIYGNGGADTIFGGDGNDSVYGSSSNEYIQGGAGNDTIYGNGGFDIIYAGEGDNLIYGGSQAERIFALSGNDTIYANGGGDFINSGAGLDTIWLGSGAATVVLEAGVGYDTINNFQLGATQFRVNSLENLTFTDSTSGVQILLANQLLAVVAGQSASNFNSNASNIFTFV